MGASVIRKGFAASCLRREREWCSRNHWRQFHFAVGQGPPHSDGVSPPSKSGLVQVGHGGNRICGGLKRLLR